MAAELSGEDLQELEARQDPRLLRALDIVAPGTALREGIDNIVHSRTGGLIVIGDPEEVSFLFSGGLSLDVDYTPALLYQVAKMDGAIVLNQQATQIVCANVQLMPDPTILSSETGTRHRTAERVSKQTDALVVAISERRDVVSLYLGGMKYILQDIPAVLAKANQGLATLDKYRVRLDAVSSRLTRLEFEGGSVLYDVLSVLQRAELVTDRGPQLGRSQVELPHQRMDRLGELGRIALVRVNRPEALQLGDLERVVPPQHQVVRDHQREGLQRQDRKAMSLARLHAREQAEKAFEGVQPGLRRKPVARRGLHGHDRAPQLRRHPVVSRHPSSFVFPAAAAVDARLRRR